MRKEISSFDSLSAKEFDEILSSMRKVAEEIQNLLPDRMEALVFSEEKITKIQDAQKRLIYQLGFIDAVKYFDSKLKTIINED